MLSKIKEIIKNRNMIFDILLSYILVFMLPIIINITVEAFIINSIHNETSNSAFLVVENAKRNFDNLIENVRLITKQINTNSDMTPVYKYSEDTASSYQLRVSQNVIKYSHQNTDDINDIFVYIPKKKTVITTKGIGVASTFFDAYYTGCDIEYEEWVEKTENITYTEQLRVIYKENTNETAYIEYVAPLAGSSFESYNIRTVGFPAVIIVRIDIEKLSLSEEVKKGYSDMMLYAISSDGAVVADFEADSANFDYVISKYNGTGIKNFRKNGTVFICCRSDVYDWIYVVSAPLWNFNQKAIIAIVLVMLSTAILLAVGLKMINRFVKAKYGGLIKFGESIFNKMSMSENIKLENINEVLDRILYEREKYENEIDRVNDAVNNAYIIRLLEGMQIKEDDSAFIKLKSTIASDKFIVLCCEVERCIGLYSGTDYTNINYGEKVKDSYFIVRNILEEIVDNAGYKINGVLLRNKCVFLVGNQNKSIEIFENDIQKLSQNFIEYINKKFSIECVVAIGKTVNKYNDIASSFIDASDALRYKILLEDNFVISAYQYRNHSDSYEITQGLRQQMILNLASGNLSEVIDAIDKVYRENFEKRKLSYEMIQCFIIELSGIFETASEDDIIRDGDFAIEALELDRIYNTKRYFEMLAEVMCKENSENRTEKGEEVVKRILQYIDEYYADENINVFAVANVIGLSRGYVSRLFKNQTGEGILDYIHKKRVEASRALLENGLSVNDVAHKVGYVNSSVFIKQFKKYVGLTPKQYTDKL